MGAYIYPLSHDEAYEFEITGIIDLSNPENPRIDFKQYEDIYIFDKDMGWITGPFKMLDSNPKNYYRERKLISEQVSCRMESSVYHLDWTSDLIGDVSQDLQSFLESEFLEISKTFHTSSVTGDYMVDGLLSRVLKKEEGRFKGHILQFPVGSPLVQYFHERLDAAGIRNEISGSSLQILNKLDKEILSINAEDYLWNVEFAIGYIAQELLITRTGYGSGAPETYSYGLTLLDKDADLQIFACQKQGIFVHHDAYGRPFVSHMVYGIEPLTLFGPNEVSIRVDKTVQITEESFRFFMSVKVLENMMVFNSCDVSELMITDDFALLEASNSKEKKRILALAELTEKTTGIVPDSTMQGCDIIILLKPMDSELSPAWIHAEDMDDYIRGEMLIIPRLGTTTILGMDTNIVYALSDKIDRIWKC